jgi:hypothetical protein
MLALRVAAEVPHVELVEAEDPEPLRNEGLVRVAAFSLNRGEVLDLPRGAAGAEVGWDFAGTVEQPTADGSGPAAGTRVVGLVKRGAWAELVVVPTAQLAVIPAAVSDAEAATLPTAGLTALRSLELGGLPLAKRVLVAGATGGVGQVRSSARSAGRRPSDRARSRRGTEREAAHALGRGERGRRDHGRLRADRRCRWRYDVRISHRTSRAARARRQPRDRQRRRARRLPRSTVRPIGRSDDSDLRSPGRPRALP